MKLKTNSLSRRKLRPEKSQRDLSYPLTYKDVVELLKIIDESDRGELHVELEDFKLSVVKR